MFAEEQRRSLEIWGSCRLVGRRSHCIGTANGEQKHMERSTISAEMAQRIELWPIERLVPYERNARTHSDHQIRQIANSIAEFGFTNPILVDTQAGTTSTQPSRCTVRSPYW